ncbi:MAG: hypothetical protein WAS07_04900 [Micropruina sp.]|nr:hypothetical protein [Micropruina sp.]
MAKRPSKHLRAPRPLSVTHATSETRHDGVWMVQTMSAHAAVKTYLCPGCLQQIREGTPHLVTWPLTPGLLSTSGVEERRHWHTPCWRRRR